MNSGKVLLGLLAGVAAGALLGVLLAPEKGSDTRKKILRKGDEYADALKEKFNDMIETVTEKIETVKDDVSGFADQVRQQANGAEKAAKSGTV